jgi:aminoglycoside phosphotransferase (APT) family kinase protein
MVASFSDMAAQPDIEALVDVGRLSEWMEGEGLGRGEIVDLERLSGGTQNILLRFRRGGREYVLRRPPLQVRPESNETMRREARVLRALAGSQVPHPSLLAACPDEAILGAAFYLMEPIDGFNATERLPPLHAGSPEVRHRMGLALAEGALLIARIEVDAVGLTDFGKPANFLQRQVGRWETQLEGYAKFEDWPGAGSLPGIGDVADYLRSNCPTSFTSGLIHGDYTLTNVMYRPDSGELAAIIDWELSTIGDPLIDLGWMLATWPGVPPVELNVLRVEPWDGFPSAEEIVEHYAAGSARSLSHLDWYFTLACFKLGIILEGSFARACAGRDPMPVGERLHEAASKLVQRALHRMG